ncbi:MAG: hypothetical protein FGM37_02950, partial [Phycisphaerales bacterium]|nr:hypothetical protein [Phycisphaerales bacterium]
MGRPLTAWRERFVVRRVEGSGMTGDFEFMSIPRTHPTQRTRVADSLTRGGRTMIASAALLGALVSASAMAGGNEDGTILVSSSGAMYRAPGSAVAVSVQVSDLAVAAVGVQLFVEWDTTELTFVSAGGHGPFQLIRTPLLLDVPGSPTRQRLALATGLVEGGVGITSGVLGHISFEVSPGALVCAPESLLDFGPTGLVYSTKLSSLGGEPIPFQAVADVVFGTDTVAPQLVGVPQSVVLSPGTTASPALDAFLAAVVTAPDACGEVTPSRVVSLPDGTSAANYPSVFPEGVTTVTWTATDGSSNSATQSRTVTVEPCPGPFATYYLDGDGDGFGQSSVTTVTCVGAPPGYAVVGGDCNDGAAAVNPGASETCNGIDDNCVDGVDEGFTDSDSDGSADCVDGDDDGDGDPDGSDCAPLDADIYTGAAELCDSVDSDCDGSLVDDFQNSDGDAYPDCIDGDDDGDGVDDAADNCPLVPNMTQADLDGDGTGDACDGDRDGDGTDNAADQCPDTYALSAPIPFYADSDQDGAGDPDSYVLACTSPGAGWVTIAGDGCPTDTAKLAPGTCGCGVADTDTDSDTVPDCIDNCVTTPNPSQVDCDGDSYGDACSTAPDCNSNGIPDSCDIASRHSADADGNGVPDSCQADCDSNGLPDSYDLVVTPSRDFDANGTLDVCEGRTFWIGGASGGLAAASNWSGGLPGGAVPAVFDTAGTVSVTSAGGTLGNAIVVRSGSVLIRASAPLTLPSLSVGSGASLSLSGVLMVLGDATVLVDGRLSLAFDGWLSVGGRLDCRQQSTLGLELRLSTEPFVTAGSGSFLGSIDVTLGSVSPWTVQPGTRFTLVQTSSLESSGFFAALFSPELGPNLLAVVGPGGSLQGIDRLEVEVTPITQVLEPAPSGSAPVTGVPTALEVAELTGDAFEDTALTVSFGPDSTGFLYVLQSSGTGTFSGQGTYPTDPEPQGVRAGRFDSTDATLDLAVTSAGAATLRAYRNVSQTVTGFVAGPAASTVADPRALAVVTPIPAGEPLEAPTDLVVVVGFGSNSMQGFSSGNEGQFVPGNAIQLGGRPGGVGTSSGSSKPDRRVAVALSSALPGGPGEVVTVVVEPDGTLVPSGSVLGPSRPTDVESDDLDGDGLSDVLVTAENGSVNVLRGTQSGLAFSGSFPAGTLPARDGAIGDFDGDGRPDLAVALLGFSGADGAQVSLFLKKNVVLVFQEKPSHSFEQVRERVRRGTGKIRYCSADYLYYALLDEVIDRYFPVLDHLNHQLSTIEDQIFSPDSRAMSLDQDIIQHIHMAKSDLLLLHRTIWPMSDLIGMLMREDTALITKN